jgi:hypothetical protein
MRLGLSLLLTAALMSCKTVQPGAGASNALIDKDAQARIFLREKCVIEAQRGGTFGEEALPAGAIAVISSVAPKVINAIVDAGAAYLEKRKTDLTGSASARGASEIYAYSADVPPRPQLGCVAFARAHFGELLVPKGAWTPERLKNLGFSTAPSLYAEFQVVYSRDMRAVRLQPVYLEYNMTSAARIGSKKKDLLFTGFLESPFGPLAEMETKRFGAFQLSLDGVELGSVMNAAALAGSTSQWIPLPQPEAFESRRDHCPIGPGRGGQPRLCRCS